MYDSKFLCKLLIIIGQINIFTLSYLHIPAEIDKSLVGQELMSIPVIGQKMCVHVCVYVSGDCMSINYVQNSLTCTLNRVDANASNVSKETRQGSKYIDIAQIPNLKDMVGSCASLKCPSYMKCVATFSRTVCVLTCPPGTYRVNSTSCETCQPGTYSSVVNSQECSKCPGGTYQSESGKSNCTLDCYQSDTKYLGHVNVTENGRQCQRWDSQVPHAHDYHVEPTAIMNYCRDFDYASPWCYTVDSSIRWENCSVPAC